MPASYTHYLIAKEVFKKLPATLQTKIRPYLSLYFFGAQGADFCFFYQYLNANIPNLGSYLHRKGGFNAFSVLQLFSYRQADLRAYSLGFITHYAADTAFHPYVYALSGKSPVTHNRVEQALDEYFKKNSDENDPHLKYLRTPPKQDQRKTLFFAYAAIAAKCGFPPLRYPAFSRSISLFHAYPSITSTLLKKKDEAWIFSVANEQKNVWSPPASPKNKRFDSANDLFEKATSQSLDLITTFLRSVTNKTTLPRSAFSKNYLTGI